MSLLCATARCGAEIDTPVGHDRCRRHADCCKSAVSGPYWDPFDCSVCRPLWMQATGTDPILAVRARTSLKTWVGGWAISSTKPFLPSMQARDLLFPRVGLEKIISEEEQQEAELLRQQPEDINKADDKQFVSFRHGDENVPLQDPEAPMDVEDVSALGNSPVEQPLSGRNTPTPVEAEPREPRGSSALLCPPPQNPGTSKSQEQVSNPIMETDPLILIQQLAAQMMAIKSDISQIRTDVRTEVSTVIGNVDTLAGSVNSLRKEVEAAPRPRPLSTMPPKPETTDIHNPWRDCSFLALNAERTHLMTNAGEVALNTLEFSPNLEAFPFCWCRVTRSAGVAYIPKEIELLPVPEATVRMAALLETAGFEATELRAFKSRRPVLQMQPDLIFPFLMKAVKATFEEVQKESLPITNKTFRENDMVGIVVPGASDLNREWLLAPDLFAEVELQKSVASHQLKETLPDLTNELVKKEYKARRELADVITLSTLFESATEVVRRPELSDCLPVGQLSFIPELFELFSKLHFRRLCTALNNFAQAKMECRQHVLQHCKVKWEANELLKSNILTPLLFPEKMVRDILVRCRAEAKTVRERWRLDDSGPSTSGYRRPPSRGKRSAPSPSPSTSRTHSQPAKRGLMSQRGHRSLPPYHTGAIPKQRQFQQQNYQSSPTTNQRWESQKQKTFQPSSSKIKGTGRGKSTRGRGRGNHPGPSSQ